MNQTNPESLKTLKKIIKSTNVAMLVTYSEDKRIVARPMQMQDVEFDGDLWFLTTTDTEKYDEIKHNDKVNVIIVDSSYASISGTAEIVNDIERKKEFWNKGYEVMFGLEYTDPRLTLIKVHAETAEYWDTGSMMKSVINFMKRAIGKDESPAPGNGINETLEL